MPIIPIFKWLGAKSLLAYRVASWAVLIGSFVFALVVCWARFWLLPNIAQYRETIQQNLTAAAGQRIAIGALEGSWSGVNLLLTLNDVAVYDKAGQPALKLERVSSVLSWWSLATLQPRFESIGVEGPELDIRRDERGVVSVAGIEIGKNVDGGGLSDWLLRQGEITIRGATIRWNDALRGAPELALTSVDFRLDNAGARHRFGLRAVPPQALATPLDVRGDLSGRTFDALAQWNGQLFVQLDYVDIAAWRTWLDFPVSFPQGVGALRVWLTLARGEPAELTADVQLAQVKTKLGADLAELQLDELKGRVGWKQDGGGFEVTTSKLGLSGHSTTLQPMDLTLRYRNAAGGKPARGELQVNALDFEPVFAIADHLPFNAELRKEIEAYAPRGSLYDVVVRWSGEWPRPEQYALKARFVNLGLNPVGSIPGFQNVSGQIDGSEKGGTVYLNTQNAQVALPLLFAEKFSLDLLTAQVGWQKAADQYEIRLNTVAFSNSDLSGSISGTYQTAAEGPGAVDISGTFNRADARGVPRYLPLQIPERARTWLGSAFHGGTSQDVRLKLRGNLRDFPFPEGRGGLFEVIARVNGGVLDYAPGWPRIENIEGDLTFRGRRMDVIARSGSIFGAKLARVRAEIADTWNDPHILTVNGEAEGPTVEFLTFIEKSPVAAMIEHFTDGMRAEGNGKLALKLTIPLSDTGATRVAGTYQFINNAISSPEAYFPPAEQLNGRLEFTESGLRVQNATLNMLGGPASINATTLRDGTRINLAGRVNMDNFRRTSGSFVAQALSGITDWRATVTLRKQFADIVLESSLQGVASNLPAPFAKTAAEAMPFRFERVVASAQQDRFAFSLGGVVAGQLQRRRDGATSVFDRGNVNFGGAPAPADRRGIWVTGSVKNLDIDQWLALFKGGSAGGVQFDLGGVDLKLGGAELFGRHYNEFSLAGSAQGGNWQVTVNGRELAGDVSWRPQGRGRVTARMKTLTIPARKGPRVLQPADSAPLELPALDIVAEQFQYGEIILGKLELNAQPDGRDWKIERLRIVNPDGSIQADGVWQAWLTQPRTMVNVKLDVHDIGKLLQRFGYPEGVRGGTGKLEGPLSWAGHPGELDYATLSGNFVVEAAKGQFLKLDPGAGKLLGILSLQSLPRRLSLDFRDIFSDGLAFDEIVGAVKVNRGVANTENLRIQGPAVRILMSGDVDLNAETQKLRVKVFPSLSDSLSVAGALVAGPIAGIAAFVAQKLLKDPLNQMASFEYSVTGTWADPQVVKLDSSQAAAADKADKAEKADKGGKAK